MHLFTQTFPVMKQRTVSFTFLSRDDYEYQITATVMPGRPGQRQGFDRFQEPDDPDEVEIIKVLALDDDGNGHPSSVDVFSNEEIADIEAKACEEYHNTGKDEEDYPDFF